jgi:ankyrin repeat protein
MRILVIASILVTSILSGIVFADWGITSLRVGCNIKSDEFSIQPFVAWSDGNSLFSEFGGETASTHKILKINNDTFYALDRETLNRDIEHACKLNNRIIRVLIKNGELTINEGDTYIVERLEVDKSGFVINSIYELKSSTKGMWQECRSRGGISKQLCQQYNLERINTPALLKAGNTSEIDTLLAKGADINSHDIEGVTSLHNAVNEDNIELASFLIKRGASVDMVDAGGRTPLTVAASRCNIKSARLLLKHGADVDGASKDSPPLIWALLACNNAIEMVSLLLEWKADPNIRSNPKAFIWNDKGQTALSIIKQREKSFRPGSNPEFEEKTKRLKEILVKAGAKE